MPNLDAAKRAIDHVVENSESLEELEELRDYIQEAINTIQEGIDAEG